MDGASEEVSAPPIYLGGGKYMEVNHDAAEISTYWLGCISSGKQVIMWSAIEDMAVEWHCFSGSITLKLKDGAEVVLKGSHANLMHAATSIKRMQAKRKDAQLSISDRKAQCLLHRNGRRIHDVDFNGQPHKTVGITHEGVMLRNKTGWCSSSPLIVPWGKLVGISIVPTCCGWRRQLTITSQSSVPEANDTKRSLGESLSEDGNDVIHETKEAILEHLLEYKTVTWTTGTAHGEAIFDAVTYMMGFDDKEATEIETQSHITDLTEAGLTVKSKLNESCFGDFGGSASRHFLPWSSVVSSSWTSASCCFGKPVLTIMDLNGTQLALTAATEKDFKTFRASFCSHAPRDHRWNEDFITKMSVAEQSPELIMEASGVLLHKRHSFCRKSITFVPWSKVGATLLQTSCFGGVVELITTAGKTLSVVERGLAGRRRLWAVCKQLHELKYGVPEVPYATARCFNVRRQSTRTSEVNDFYVKLVFEHSWCTTLIREYDLSNIVSCRVADVNEQKVLVLKVACAGDMLEVVTLPLDAVEDSQEILDDILARSQRKKGANSKLLPESAGPFNFAIHTARITDPLDGVRSQWGVQLKETGLKELVPDAKASPPSPSPAPGARSNSPRTLAEAVQEKQQEARRATEARKMKEVSDRAERIIAESKF